jgi:autotransporter adhesin
VGYAAVASAINALALGNGATANFANSVALGAGSVTTVGAQTGYTAYGLTAPQNSTGEVNIGGRQMTGVAAGSAATDAVNVSQLQGAIADATADAVTYDNSTHNSVTLNKGGSPTTITNVAAGDISANSTDAVNGSQLYETNNRVTNVENQISNIGDTVNNINNGGGIRYFRHNVSDDSMPDASAGGYASVAVGSGATTTANATNSVAMGVNATVDAANGLALGSGSNVTVANSVALGAGAVANKAATPVNNATVGNMAYGGFAGSTPVGVVSVGAQGAERQVTNVAAGQITATSTDAVNGSQLYSVADGLNKKIDNSVQYDSQTDANGNPKPGDGNDITLKGDGGTRLHNVADGTAPNDAATVGQLNNAVAGINQQMNALGQRIEEVNKDANAGAASAMAMANMPQATIPGKGMASAGVAAYQGQVALAMGVSKLSDDGRWVTKVSGTVNSRGNLGVAGGIGFHW